MSWGPALGTFDRERQARSPKGPNSWPEWASQGSEVVALMGVPPETL